MDKVQIYLLFMFTSSTGLIFVHGVTDPSRIFSNITNLERLAYLPITIALWVPVYGRIFGWW